MGNKNIFEIIKILTNINFTDCNDTGRIKYIVWHYVGATGGGKANCNYYASTYVGASAHYYADFDGSLYQSVEDEDISWAVGSSYYVHPTCRNSNSINIELCVRKRNTNTMNATDKDWYFEDATVKSAIELTLYLMKKYNVSSSNVFRHYDVTGKICPNPLVYDNGKYKWNDIKKALSSGIPTPPTVIDLLYRVGKKWSNGNVIDRLGAYESLTNAKNACPSGYKVFDWNGKCVYSPTVKGTQPSTFSKLTESETASKILELVKGDYLKSGVLASISAAQMILESGYVKTDLAVNACNCFGMKTTLSKNDWLNSTWDGASKYTKATSEEYTPGQITQEKADFRKYSCLEDSIGDHSAYLLGAKNGNELRYEGLKNAKDYRKAITIIKNGGYATDSKYIDKICNIIKRFGLDKYDKISVLSPTAPTLKYKVGQYVNCSSYYGTPADGTNKAIIKPLSGLIVKVDATKTNPYQIEKYYCNEGDIRSTGKPESAFKHYDIKVTSSAVYIRSNAGTEYSTKGFTGKGIFSIVEEKKDNLGRHWGLLKSYGKNRNGWIALWLTCLERV